MYELWQENYQIQEKFHSKFTENVFHFLQTRFLINIPDLDRKQDDTTSIGLIWKLYMFWDGGY